MNAFLSERAEVNRDEYEMKVFFTEEAEDDPNQENMKWNGGWVKMLRAQKRYFFVELGKKLRSECAHDATQNCDYLLF